jgi:hypothetical protein
MVCATSSAAGATKTDFITMDLNPICSYPGGRRGSAATRTRTRAAHIFKPHSGPSLGLKMKRGEVSEPAAGPRRLAAQGVCADPRHPSLAASVCVCADPWVLESPVRVFHEQGGRSTRRIWLRCPRWPRVRPKKGSARMPACSHAAPGGASVSTSGLMDYYSLKFIIHVSR